LAISQNCDSSTALARFAAMRIAREFIQRMFHSRL
jgi:hypothetical protein